MKDNKTLITCGKDKLVIVTDIVQNHKLFQDSTHSDTVTSIALSADENYLFSADKKGILHVYYT